MSDAPTNCTEENEHTTLLQVVSRRFIVGRPSQKWFQHGDISRREHQDEPVGHGIVNIQMGAEVGDRVEKVALGDVHRLHNSNGSCLNFIHIPKNAGSSIEDVSLTIRSGNSGVHAWGYRNKNLPCLHHHKNWCSIHDRQERTIGGAFVWHLPPSWDSLLLATYKQCTTFCVVRDPLAKLKSEWTYFGGCDKEESFNDWVVKSLEQVRHDPFFNSGHFLPQAEYVWGGVITSNGERSKRMRYCDRVLRLENLTEEFTELMDEFHLPVSLVHHNPSKHCNATVTESTQKLIRDTYATDYTTFGY
eukprot:TRINITY_DN3190_c0_g1_i5.p1 TRINITY_DN3190_c0_g1~~TRINITY_DN3190_c0_g1_i5.p1  ORF type:complete len:348 (+),score=38.57 TRINITY_DN3190_c0_g1_i5:136-1044(+)